MKNQIMMFIIRRTKMFKDIKSWFVGESSKKRYIGALYVGVRAILLQLGYEVPGVVDQLAVAFGIWAGSDALKKLEK
jgi:hypothetical protein